MAALATTALPAPDRRAMAGLGALAGAAALTRPDGVVYLGVVVAVTFLAAPPTPRRGAALLGWGLLAFGLVFGPYLAVRLVVFDAWVPNTAVAKHQGLPSLGDLGRIRPMVRSFGWPLLVVGVGGAVVAFVGRVRARDFVALRVLTAAVAVLAAGVVAYVVLPTDWMAELRFLTPVWPLLCAGAVLGIAQVAALARSRDVRIAVAVVLALFAALVLPRWRERAEAFRAAPTVPLCSVATAYGLRFDAATRIVDRAPGATRVLLPDIGGVLLAADFRVVDLAGLAHRRIAQMIGDDDSAALARYVVDDVRPTFVYIHDDWVARSGLLGDAGFRTDYADVGEGRLWVRRAVLSTADEPAATRAALERLDGRFRAPPPRSSCAGTLFG